VIQCGELTTTVLGTSFNIKSTAKNIEVVVLTGKVALTSANDKKGVILLPNEKAVYNGDQGLLEKRESEVEEKVAAVKDTQYPMDFEDTRMEEIIRRIEGKFNVKVRITDSNVANCMITADFTDQSLEGTVNMISQALGFSYEVNGREVMVKGGGCE
jgi:ferric-dicitrate binding protein FerR (iron transport regulator)